MSPHLKLALAAAGGFVILVLLIVIVKRIRKRRAKKRQAAKSKAATTVKPVVPPSPLRASPTDTTSPVSRTATLANTPNGTADTPQSVEPIQAATQFWAQSGSDAVPVPTLADPSIETDAVAENPKETTPLTETAPPTPANDALTVPGPDVDVEPPMVEISPSPDAAVTIVAPREGVSSDVVQDVIPHLVPEAPLAETSATPNVTPAPTSIEGSIVGDVEVLIPPVPASDVSALPEPGAPAPEVADGHPTELPPAEVERSAPSPLLEVSDVTLADLEVTSDKPGNEVHIDEPRSEPATRHEDTLVLHGEDDEDDEESGLRRTVVEDPVEGDADDVIRIHLRISDDEISKIMIVDANDAPNEWVNATDKKKKSKNKSGKKKKRKK